MGPFTLPGEPSKGHLGPELEQAAGQNLGRLFPVRAVFGESLLRLGISTQGPGKRIWHLQLVHDGIWDYDLPAPAEDSSFLDACGATRCRVNRHIRS
jgi:hypothetical protein